MLKSSARSAIRLRGVRHNNLKNLDLDLPLNQLIVVTGLSGSGKSSLAFDTLFAEGQRRYIETFSPYARQFLDRMDKPQVDSIEGIPPAIAIEQRNSVKTTRSTVGTMTELCDYMKMLWPQVAQLYCRGCGRPVRKDSPQRVWGSLTCRASSFAAPAEFLHDRPAEVNQCSAGAEVLLTFDLPLTAKLSLGESLALISKQGYQRLLVDGVVIRLDEFASRAGQPAASLSSLTVVQDRLSLNPGNRARFIEACEQAYHFGKGKLAIRTLLPRSTAACPQLFSNRLHCAQCDIEYREPSPALFSFNHPVGACPTCRGFGRVIGIDYDLALPDRSKTLAEGAIKPWQTGHGVECQNDLRRMCRHFEIPMDVPFEKLSKKWQDFVTEGDPDYGKDDEHRWPRAWYGIKGYFRWLESKSYKMHVRVLLSRYRSYSPCPDCHGQRFQPESLLYKVGQASRLPSSERNPPSNQPLLTLADFYQLPIRDALRSVEALAEAFRIRRNDPLGLVLNEVRSRLGYLNDVGLGYLTLDRPTRSLSGGETERVNLTACLGTRLVNTLFVLDEPSVGLHPCDTARLVRILQQLRDAGNTVLVVEHEASVMRAADQILDLGPGHGATGGEIVFQGTYPEILQSKRSLTGQYLSGRKEIPLPARRPVNVGQASRLPPRRNSHPRPPNDALEEGAGCPSPALTLSHATLHNLKGLTVAIPLDRFVCITGVSGSGKTTLVREILLPELTAQLKAPPEDLKACERTEPESNAEDEEAPPPGSRLSTFLNGAEYLGRVVLVDQSILGKTPRSNPAVYIGAFDDVREFFAQSELAKQRGLNASAFSFNSGQGQCERCRGAGFEKIEMQFLSDIFIRCPDCNGRRYRSHILEVKLSPPSQRRPSTKRAPRSFSIADLLESTVEEALDFLEAFPESRPAQRAAQGLKLLREVGLGYVKLGQPINTLSGGESQRLKLVKHLVEAVEPEEDAPAVIDIAAARQTGWKPTLFLFDEPTTGLHFDDVRLLLKVFQRLVDGGHSVVVIEHNLDVIKSADWLLDLGPGAGDEGGQLVAQGTPEAVAMEPRSSTGEILREVLRSQAAPLRPCDAHEQMKAAVAR